jgi:hypothetical protein
VNDLRSSNVFLFDHMAKEKLQAKEQCTFLSNSHRFQSIIDKTFTTFPTEHCESTQILDWHTYSKVGLSDHRAVITEVSLSSLCEGWIGYLSKPFRLPPRIDITKLQKSLKQKCKKQSKIGNEPSQPPLPVFSSHLPRFAQQVIQCRWIWKHSKQCTNS